MVLWDEIIHSLFIVKSLGRVRLFAIPWTVVYQGFSLSMGFSRQELLEWVAISFSRGSSWPRDRTQVSCIAGRSLTHWATRSSVYIFLTKKYLLAPKGVSFHFWMVLVIKKLFLIISQNSPPCLFHLLALIVSPTTTEHISHCSV